MNDGTFEMMDDLTTSRRQFMGGRGRLVLVGVVLALAVAYLIYAAFPGSTSYYFTVDELAAFDGRLDGRTFRVKGALVPDSFIRDEGSTLANFTITAGEQVLPATYNGVVPDLFFNANSEIIIQGRFADPDGVFKVDTVSVLCPTKYEALEDTVS